ncbi:ORC2-domain-containing protein [Pleurostoma richardsiae]|uniref:Origin recognition complex subunit 2 n=1 Tax=Pleurostoma richardsiae TaxID=41990 RepID=A0AA38RUP8_9PEZI|nr:ORC2-domain-containing protein [Pleurostoma richardsiae]
MDVDVPTPPKRKRGRPPKNATPIKPNGVTPKKSARFKDTDKPETPVKLNGAGAVDTPSRRNIADRSARRKSARALIDRVVAGDGSDDEAGDEGLAREIYESSGSENGEENGEEAEESDDDVEGNTSTAVTPSRRGHKKGTTRKKSPTPPRDLPRHEMYFYQNKPGRPKTSNNTLSSLDLLTHEEYFSCLREHKNQHREAMELLETYHTKYFRQWEFEMSQGFSICLFGYGSKRSLLHRFAKQLFSRIQDHSLNKIVVLNGYVRTISLREILTTVGNAVDPSHKLVSGNAVLMLGDLSSLLSSSDITLTLILNSADATPLRKAGVQSIISQLAAHPRIHLICSVDTPDFSLLWDSGVRSSFNFTFHNSTTFAPFSAEHEVVDDVHELLGRKARRVGGKDGVAFVLRSLPENAKNLFRLLVGEVLALMDEEGSTHGENHGIEYRMAYNKAVEEFICSSEMAFRTLLKEFHDHQMITSSKDVIGTELLSLPFRKDELEAILEDLVS